MKAGRDPPFPLREKRDKPFFFFSPPFPSANRRAGSYPSLFFLRPWTVNAQVRPFSPTFRTVPPLPLFFLRAGIKEVASLSLFPSLLLDQALDAAPFWVNFERTAIPLPPLPFLKNPLPFSQPWTLLSSCARDTIFLFSSSPKIKRAFCSLRSDFAICNTSLLREMKGRSPLSFFSSFLPCRVSS